MIAIATLLELSANTKTAQTWQWLENECGLSGIKVAPMPHLSWQVSVDYNLDEVVKDLKLAAKSLQPFTVSGYGLGIFTREIPVLYYSLIKTEALIGVHQTLWNSVSGYAEGILEFYSPKTWIPHITLAYKDVTPDKLACGVAGLAFRSIALEIVINHFSVIYLDGTDFGMKFNVEFSG